MARISRRKFLFSLGVLGTGTAAVGYWGAQQLEVIRRTVKIGPQPLPQPIKILHVSDFHVTQRNGLDMVEKAAELGLAEKPDLICITGDFVSYKWFDAKEYTAALSRFSAKTPTFACLGNHDGGRWSSRRLGFKTTAEITQLLKDSKITLMQNTSCNSRINGNLVRLTGVGDYLAGDFSAHRAFAAPLPREPHVSIVLLHNPDFKAFIQSHPWDLLLCGHTHGGQICIPMVGPLYLPVDDRRFVAGLYRWNNRWLHITKGVGSTFNFRFNCPPEVSLLTLI